MIVGTPGVETAPVGLVKVVDVLMSLMHPTWLGSSRFSPLRELLHAQDKPQALVALAPPGGGRHRLPCRAGW